MISISVYRPPPVDTQNHSIIDVTIEEVDVVLSLLWMLEGLLFSFLSH